MASAVGRKIARGYVGSAAKAYEPADPRFETFVDANGRERQRERPMPTGLSKLEEKTLRKIRRRAHRLDKGMNLCGFRVGYTFFIGLIPVVGDIADFLLSYSLIIRPAKKCDIPAVLQSKMVTTSLVATGLCMVPLVGDIIAYAVIRPNSRNAHMFEAYLIEKAASNPTQAGQDISAQHAVEASKGWSFNWRTGNGKTSDSRQDPPAQSSLPSAQASGQSSGQPTGQPAIGDQATAPQRQGGHPSTATQSGYTMMDNGQARCSHCNKLFQSKEFAIKHIANKHTGRV